MKILLTEDERDLSNALAALFKHSGYEVDCAYNGLEALEFTAAGSYDAIVMDVMMPEMDGITALKEMRSRGIETPVLMLTAKSEVEDKIEGLDSGADDYLTKPFAMGELLARIRVMTRHSQKDQPKVLQYGDIEVNTGNSELTAINTIILANKELKLMEILMQAPDTWHSEADIFTNVWQDEPDTDRKIVEMYVTYLKNKLKSIGSGVTIISSEEGYKINA